MAIGEAIEDLHAREQIDGFRAGLLVWVHANPEGALKIDVLERSAVIGGGYFPCRTVVRDRALRDLAWHARRGVKPSYGGFLEWKP